MNAILIGIGIAGVAYWLLSRKQASPDTTPAVPKKSRFLTVGETWDAIDGLKDDAGIAGNEQAQKLLTELKSIVVEELKK